MNADLLLTLGIVLGAGLYLLHRLRSKNGCGCGSSPAGPAGSGCCGSPDSAHTACDGCCQHGHQPRGPRL